MNNSEIVVVCIDASFLVRLLIDNRQNSPFDDLWTQWQESGYTIVAPSLLYYEVSNALHRYVVAGQFLPEEAVQILEAALNLNIRLYGDAELHQQALNLATNLTLRATYDAHYLALAQRLGSQFWTTDRRLVQSVQTTLPWVHLVEP